MGSRLYICQWGDFIFNIDFWKKLKLINILPKLKKLQKNKFKKKIIAKKTHLVVSQWTTTFVIFIRRSVIASFTRVTCLGHLLQDLAQNGDTVSLLNTLTIQNVNLIRKFTKTSRSPKKPTDWCDISGPVSQI